MSKRTARLLHEAWEAFRTGATDKWPFYALVEELHRKRRVTYAEVVLATTLDLAVVRDRVRYLRHLRGVIA